MTRRNRLRVSCVLLLMLSALGAVAGCARPLPAQAEPATTARAFLDAVLSNDVATAERLFRPDLNESDLAMLRTAWTGSEAICAASRAEIDEGVVLEGQVLYMIDVLETTTALNGDVVTDTPRVIEVKLDDERWFVIYAQ